MIDIDAPVPATAGRHTRGTARWQPFMAFAPLLALAVYLWVAGQADLPRAAATRALVTIAVTQVLPGVLLWRSLRPRAGWWFEDVCMGAAIGVPLAVAAQTIGGLLGSPWPAILVGPLIVAVLIVVPRSRRRIVDAQTQPLPWAFGPVVAGASLLLLAEAQRFFRLVPLEYPGFMEPYVDMPFHLALAGQLAHRGPTGFPHVAGEPLSYHWFSHAWAAQVGVAGDVELDAILYRVLPGVVTVALVALVAAAATRISGRAVAGPLAALLAAGAGILSFLRPTTHMTIVRHLSPSLGLSTLLLVALVVVLTLRWRGEFGRAGPGLVVLLAVAAGGTKGSALPVLVGGLALAAVTSQVSRAPERRRVANDLALVLGTLTATFIVLFKGGTQETTLDPTAALERIDAIGPLLSNGGRTPPVLLFIAGILVLAGVAALGGGVLAFVRERSLLWDPVTALLLGTGVAGGVAVVALSHPGESQGYFLRTALPCLAILSAWGVSHLWSRSEQRGDVVLASLLGATVWLVAQHVLLVRTPVTEMGPWGRVVVGLTGLSLTLGMAAWIATRRRRGSSVNPWGAAGLTLVVAVAVPALVSVLTIALPDPAEIVRPDRPGVFSGDQIEAARWIRDHSAADELVATNRHCRNPRGEQCDNRRFFVAAYTERQVLVEGWGYTPSVVDLSVKLGEEDSRVPFWDADRLALNDGFLTSPTPEGARDLWELGVRWVFVDEVVDHAEDFGDLAVERHATEYATVYELRPPTREASR